MRALWFLSLLSLLGLALTSCQTIKLVEDPNLAFCQNLDWYEIGRSDGTSGRDASLYTAHKERCGTTPFPPNEDMYMNGREAGLAEFCTARVGYEFGRNGGKYQGVCTEHLEKAFLPSYQLGQRVFQLQKENSSLEAKMDLLYRKATAQEGGDLLKSEIDHARKRHAENETEINSIEDAAISL